MVAEREGVRQRHKIISELKSELDSLNSEFSNESNNERSLKRRLGDLILRNKSILLCLRDCLGVFVDTDGMKSRAAALVEAKVGHMYIVNTMCTPK